MAHSMSPGLVGDGVLLQAERDGGPWEERPGLCMVSKKGEPRGVEGRKSQEFRLREGKMCLWRSRGGRGDDGGDFSHRSQDRVPRVGDAQFHLLQADPVLRIIQCQTRPPGWCCETRKVRDTFLPWEAPGIWVQKVRWGLAPWWLSVAFSRCLSHPCPWQITMRELAAAAHAHRTNV